MMASYSPARVLCIARSNYPILPRRVILRYSSSSPSSRIRRSEGGDCFTATPTRGSVVRIRGKLRRCRSCCRPLSDSAVYRPFSTSPNKKTMGESSNPIDADTKVGDVKGNNAGGRVSMFPPSTVTLKSVVTTEHASKTEKRSDNDGIIHGKGTVLINQTSSGEQATSTIGVASPPFSLSSPSTPPKTTATARFWWSDRTDDEYSPRHPPTHFIKGGTPCDPAPPPFRLADYGDDSLYTLVLLRHGESEWNSQNRYTGWCDVDLTPRGEKEAQAAGRLLLENGIELDHAFTSVLKRASFTTNIALSVSKQHWVPVTKSWRLNERHYGALQGYNKDTAYEELGIDQELVMEMRRSYDTRPPRMEDDHPYWHGNDRRYAKLSAEQLDKTRSESLKDTAERILPFFNSIIIPSLRAGNKCIVISHANTLRTLIKHIDNISDEDIKGMSIPTGVPMLYRLDRNMKPVDPKYEQEFRYMVEPKGYTWATSRAHGFHGVYLGDLERLQEIQRKRDISNRDWQRIILRNLAQCLDEDNDAVVETRQLWWKIHEKMQNKEFGNMLLLARMKDHLEDVMVRRQRYMTLAGFDSVIKKIHLENEGQIVEPFVPLDDREEREERQRHWYENLALDLEDLEEECLIK